MKVCVLGYFGCANTGDEAILHCFLKELERRAPGVDVTVFSGDPEETRTIHQVKAVPHVLPTTLERLAVGVLGRSRKSFFACLNTFLTSDILVIGGGGLLFDHPHANQHLLDLLLFTRWAKRLGKKVVYVGIGAGPLHSPRSIERLREILPMVDLICARDPDSAALLAEIGVNHPNLHVTGDFVFLMEPVSQAEARRLLEAEGLAKQRPNAIGICLNGELIENEKINSSVRALVAELLRNDDQEVWFIPMQTGGGYDDRAVADKIMRDLPATDAVKHIRQRHTPWQTMGIMREALDAVVSVRLHGAILAVGNGTPVFGISYLPKVFRLFKELGHTDWQCQLADLTPERLSSGFAEVWNHREQIRQELPALCEPIRQRSRLNVELFAQQYLHPSTEAKA
jgi:polysaccharide pyruvyl transferase CsaB